MHQTDGPADLALRLGLGVAHDVLPAFSWTHMGHSDLPVGDLLATIAAVPGLHPPRTGHVGNWADIVEGRAGALDFNQAACLLGSAYPLLYPFTKTEDAALTAGDWAYAPASRVRRGRRRLLSLHIHGAGGPEPCNHQTPRFVPFLLGEVDGDLVPLIELHGQSTPSCAEFPFRLESSLLAGHDTAVRAMLTTLVDAARTSANPRRSLAHLIDCDVGLDGTVRRSTVEVDRDEFRVGEHTFPDTRAFVEALMVPLRAAAEPNAFHTEPPDHRRRYPVISGHLVGLLTAMLGSHYPAGVLDRARMTQPFNPHLVWGARAMAGFPPREPGYFARRATARAMTWMANCLVSELDVDPIFFVVLPAAIFLLCVPDTLPYDCEAMAALVAAVRKATCPDVDPADGQRRVDEVVANWLDGDGRALSLYSRHRFAVRSGAVHDFAALECARPVAPPGFHELSLRQVCLTIGSLSSAFASNLERYDAR